MSAREKNYKTPERKKFDESKRKSEVNSKDEKEIEKVE